MGTLVNMGVEDAEASVTKVPMDAPRPQITDTSAGVEDDVGDRSGAADNGQQIHFLQRDIWRPWT